MDAAEIERIGRLQLGWQRTDIRDERHIGIFPNAPFKRVIPHAKHGGVETRDMTRIRQVDRHTVGIEHLRRERPRDRRIASDNTDGIDFDADAE